MTDFNRFLRKYEREFWTRWNFWLGYAFKIDWISRLVEFKDWNGWYAFGFIHASSAADAYVFMDDTILHLGIDGGGLVVVEWL